jgi:uncharacterized protein DUF6959
MADTVKLLSGAHNYAVVHLPGRRFPGVVFQGDSLWILHSAIASLSAIASKYADEELTAELQDLRDGLGGVLAFYEETCAKHGIGLPYTKP